MTTTLFVVLVFTVCLTFIVVKYVQGALHLVAEDSKDRLSAWTGIDRAEAGWVEGRASSSPVPHGTRTSALQAATQLSSAQRMSSMRLLEPGNVSRKRQSFGEKGEQARVVAVEIVSAELAQDGGPAPDVRCTIALRNSGDASRRVVGTSVCRGAWGPVWKETLRLDLEPGTRSTRFFDLVLWDESGGEGGESSCLGEQVGLPAIVLVYLGSVFAFAPV